MFEKLKNIEAGYRQMWMVSILAVSACIIISIFSIYSGLSVARGTQDKIYVLVGGAAMEAKATDRKENIPAEGKDHIRRFQQLFFSLEPDEKAIQSNMNQAFYLADGSAKRLYDNLKEAGYFSNIISGNVSQSVVIDSVQLDTRAYPYRWKCWGREKFLRAQWITTRSLVTTGLLRTTSRSENNGHGFLIEKLEVLDNRDLLIQNRKL